MKIEIAFKHILTKSDLNRLRLLVRNNDFEKDVWRLRIIFGYEKNFDEKERPAYYNSLFKENKALRGKVLSEKGENYIEGLFKEIEALIRKYNVPLGWKIGILELTRRGEFFLTSRWIDKITFGLGEKEFEHMTSNKAAALPPASRDGLHIVLHDKVSKSELIAWIRSHWNEIKDMMLKTLPNNAGAKIEYLDFLEDIANLRDKDNLKFSKVLEKIGGTDESIVTAYYQRIKNYIESIKRKG